MHIRMFPLLLASLQCRCNSSALSRNPESSARASMLCKLRIPPPPPLLSTRARAGRSPPSREPLLLPPTVCRFNLFGTVKLDQESTVDTICLSVGMVQEQVSISLLSWGMPLPPSPQVCSFTLEGPSWAWEEPLLVQCFACFLKALNISCPDLSRLVGPHLSLRHSHKIQHCL